LERYRRAPSDAYNGLLRAEGRRVFPGGLAAPDTATVVGNRAGKAAFAGGPSQKSKEYLAAEGWMRCDRKVAAGRINLSDCRRFGRPANPATCSRSAAP
jgi:hypothetical protein